MGMWCIYTANPPPEHLIGLHLTSDEFLPLQLWPGLPLATPKAISNVDL